MENSRFNSFDFVVLFLCVIVQWRSSKSVRRLKQKWKRMSNWTWSKVRTKASRAAQLQCFLCRAHVHVQLLLLFRCTFDCGVGLVIVLVVVFCFVCSHAFLRCPIKLITCQVFAVFTRPYTVCTLFLNSSLLYRVELFLLLIVLCLCSLNELNAYALSVS